MSKVAELVSVKLIRVSKERGRQDFKGITELAESIKKHGLINPITVSKNEDETLELHAGERRFRAVLTLGWAEIPVRYMEDMSDVEKKEIELEENLRRASLHWTEEVELLRQIDELKRAQHGESRYEKDGWNLQKTAEAVGQSPGNVSAKINFAKEIKENPELKDKYGNLPLDVALKARKQDAERERLQRVFGSGEQELVKNLQHGDSKELIKSLGNESIDLLVTDPPFGIETIESMGKAKGRTSVQYSSTLESQDNWTSDDVKKLMAEIIPEIARVLKPSAHFYMFFGIEHYQLLKDYLTTAGLHVCHVPLIWFKGRSTAPFMGYDYAPSYEPILFGCKPPREKRLAESARSVLEFSPVPVNARLHKFEKPQELLKFLIKQSSNTGDTVLDPFAGSGATLVAARDVGRQSVGFEFSEKHFVAAQERLGSSS